MGEKENVDTPKNDPGGEYPQSIRCNPESRR